MSFFFFFLFWRRWTKNRHGSNSCRDMCSFILSHILLLGKSPEIHLHFQVQGNPAVQEQSVWCHNFAFQQRLIMGCTPPRSRGCPCKRSKVMRKSCFGRRNTMGLTLVQCNFNQSAHLCVYFHSRNKIQKGFAGHGSIARTAGIS